MMYVIFPAEDVVELSLGLVSPTTSDVEQLYCTENSERVPGRSYLFTDSRQRKSEELLVIKQDKNFKNKVNSSRNKKNKTNLSRNQQEQEVKMATGSDVSFRDLTHPAVNEALKTHNSVTFKLVKTVSDFTQQLSQIYEQHAEEMQLLVSNFRKRNAELRKERPACPSALFHTWETLLQEVEIDSQAHSDIASILSRQVARPLLEKSFHRKIQSRKVFTHRESYETILVKAEEKIAKCRQDYKNAYLAYMSSPSSASLATYFDTHNEYVQQLHAANGMLEQYHQETLPQLLQELDDVYTDLCNTLSETVNQGAEIISTRANEQCRRYETVSSQCKALLASADLAHFVRSLAIPHHPPHHPSIRHNFIAPQPPPPPESADGPTGETPINDTNLPPPLKNELVVDRLATIQTRTRYEMLKKEAIDLEGQIKQIQDSLDTLLRIQQRSLESNLFNKVNELQEDISMKKFDLRAAQIHLSAVKNQKELFASKVESASDAGRERKLSNSSTGSMKTKWLKAFKSLKTSTPSNGNIKEVEKKNGKDTGALPAGSVEPGTHSFQEYTYKKITPCDVCSQVLRGHTRQGLKCRICKLNIHVDCQDRVGRCQPKTRLLRRQKSTSEIETKAPPEPAQEEETPHSPRRQKLNLRMKSLSLDSPESTEQAQRRRHATATQSTPQSSQSSSSRIHSPSSPVHNRRLLSARNMRMSSVELPDDNEKSLSSASTSPCPSPKPHRLLPTNLYVVLYNFKSRHPDELDLKAGYKVTVIDTADQDWWKGKCLGRIGFFPSKYVAKLQPGERPLQVTHNLQVSDGDNGLVLLRDQIVIQVGEELDGMVMIRNGDNRQGVCPLKFLQEV